MKHVNRISNRWPRRPVPARQAASDTLAFVDATMRVLGFAKTKKFQPDWDFASTVECPPVDLMRMNARAADIVHLDMNGDLAKYLKARREAR